MSAKVGTLPDGIGEENIQPLAGWRRHASPLSLVVFGAVVALALTGWLGHERTWRAEGSGAALEVHAPEIIRNGEFLEIRIRVSAHSPITQLVVGVEESLWEDFTINTMIPAATDETSEDGEFRFTFAELRPGAVFLFKVDAQINPDILGGNDGAITIYDGEDRLSTVDVAIMVLP